MEAGGAYDLVLRPDEALALAEHFRCRGVALPSEFWAALRGRRGLVPAPLAVARDRAIRDLMRNTTPASATWWEPRTPRTDDGLPPSVELQPTKRHLRLLAWGYSPNVEAYDAWFAEVDRGAQKALRRLQARASRLREELAAFLKLTVPPIHVQVGPYAEFPQDRDHAYTEPGDPVRVVVAPRMLLASTDRQEAVLRHELGHVGMGVQGRWEDHDEQDADTLAQLVWSDPIRYDGANVQSLCTGVHPRPAHLPS